MVKPGNLAFCVPDLSWNSPSFVTSKDTVPAAHKYKFLRIQTLWEH